MKSTATHNFNCSILLPYLQSSSKSAWRIRKIVKWIFIKNSLHRQNAILYSIVKSHREKKLQKNEISQKAVRTQSGFFSAKIIFQKTLAKVFLFNYNYDSISKANRRHQQYYIISINRRLHFFSSCKRANKEKSDIKGDFSL